MAGPLEQLAQQIREHKGSLGNALAATGQQYGISAPPQQYLQDLQGQSRIPSDVASRFRHRADAIKSYENQYGFKLSEPGSWIPSLLQHLPGNDKREDYEHQKAVQAKVLKAFPELDPIHREMAAERSRTKMTQMATLEPVRQQFGVGIKAPPEEGRRAATKDEDKAIVTFISQRKAQLLAQPPYGPNYTPGTATSQALAEARVLFPQIATASILAAFGKPGMEPIPKSRYGTWIGPDRVASMSKDHIASLLDKQFNRSSNLARLLAHANTYAKRTQGTNPSLNDFFDYLEDAYRNPPDTAVDAAGKPVQPLTTSQIRNVMRETAQEISLVAALKGFY